MKCLCVLVLFSALPVFSGVINFDDIDASLGDVSLDPLSPYHGFTWTNFTVYTNTPGFPGFNNGIVSPPNAAFSGGEAIGSTVTPITGSFSSPTPFDFNSAEMGSGNYDNLDVTVEGLLGSTMLFSRTVTVNTSGAQLFNFNFDGINKVEVFGTTTAATTDPFLCGAFDCTQFTIDDINVSAATVSGVPEPRDGFLIGGVILILAAMRRNRRYAAALIVALGWICTLQSGFPAPTGQQPSRLGQLAVQFEEPLVATGPTTPQEDDALVRVIETYRAQPAEEGLSALSAFVAGHPRSPWRIALTTNLGLSWYHAGHFSKAIDAFEQAWRDGKSLTDPRSKALVDRALGELARMHARLGHADRLAALFKEIGDRHVTGPATEALTGAQEGLWMMEHEPGVAYLCGPMALKHLMLSQGSPIEKVQFLDDYRSGPQGVSLAEVAGLAERAQLNYRLVFRETGQPIPVPSIVHWKVHHFAAIVGEENGRLHIQDPTFGSDLWVTRNAVESEASGYFLVPARQASQWREIASADAKKVRGMGFTGTQLFGAMQTRDRKAHAKVRPKPAAPKIRVVKGEGCPVNPAMCGYDIHLMVVSVNLTDTPVGYTPSIGPDAHVTLTYNQREDSQPASFGWFNVSPKWTLSWLSYVQDDPNVTGASVTRYAAGGGSVGYLNYNSGTGAFMPETRDASVLVRTSGSPITYQRNMADGSREIYSQSNGATVFPRRVFLTQVIDPQGNAVTLSYDSQLRLTSLTDATSRQTTFTYGLAAQPLLITQITDPFKRSAQISYDANGRLVQITDVLGLTSQFTYDSSSLINALTTPYGTTQFSYGQNGTTRFVNATDPLGNTERVEFQHLAPGIPFNDPAATVPQGMINLLDQYLYYRDTFYWDKHAYPIAAGDYTKADITHWNHWVFNENETSNSVESIQNPLENRVWLTYPGQPNSIFSGTLDLPNGIGRVLDDGTTQLTKYTYNSLGNVTDAIDPAGRETQYVYDTNGIDLLQVKQKTSASAFSTITQLTYNGQHRPLTYTDAAGQTTTFTYNSAGQLTQRMDALGEVTQYQYDTLGRLTGAINANNQTQATFSYDGFDRVSSYTDSEGRTVRFAYDNFDRLIQETYPDGTTRQYTWNKLDLASVKDRQGRVTQYAYDAVRNLTAITDPLGRQTKFTYFENGVLKSMTDADNNTTTWNIDLESRVTAKHSADGTQLINTYEATTSRIKSITDPLGQIKQYGYGVDDRLKGISYVNAVNPTPNVSFAYDAFFPRATSMTDGSGTTQYSYQPIGTPGALDLAQDQGPFNNSTIAYSYDALGRVISRTVDASTETFAYDKLGRMISDTNALGVFDIGYLGQTPDETGWNIHNGTPGTTLTYDTNANDRRLKAITNTGATRSYQFTTTPEYIINQSLETALLGSAWAPQTWNYGYDAADRLLQGQSSTGAQYLFSYDPADNITSKQGPLGIENGNYNSVNEVASFGGQSFIYDANGNLTDDGSRTYAWDAENRLVGATYKAQPARTTTFRYDGVGRRIAIVTDGVETRYLWCATKLCQARTATDTVSRRYFPEGEVMVPTGALLYYAPDQLGSVRDVVTVQNGSRVAAFDYDPYGNPIQSGGRLSTDFRFAGMFYDGQDGLYLTEYRAYSPSIGRWLSRDPLEIGANLNAYVDNDPVNLKDPRGLQCVISLKNIQKKVSDFDSEVANWYKSSDLKEWVDELKKAYDAYDLAKDFKAVLTLSEEAVTGVLGIFSYFAKQRADNPCETWGTRGPDVICHNPSCPHDPDVCSRFP